jgi:hypothetical protein
LGEPEGLLERLHAMRVLLCLGVAAALFAGVVVAARSGGVTQPAASMALSVPAERSVAAELLPDGHPLFVVHDPRLDDVVVLDAVSPDSGPQRPKLLAWCEAAGIFEEPLHGSKFSASGGWMAGPAPSDMTPYEVVRRSDGRVVPMEPVPPIGRSAPPRQDDLLAPRGPSCLGTPPPFEGMVFHHQDRIQDALTPTELLRQPDGAESFVTGHVVRRAGRAWACDGWITAGQEALAQTCRWEDGVPLDTEGQQAAARYPDVFAGWQGLFLAQHRNGSLTVLHTTGGFHELEPVNE